MNLSKLSLQQTLFYLHLLQFKSDVFKDLNMESISISIYGTILKNLNIEEIKNDLKFRLRALLENTNRNEFVFGFTKQDFPNINSKYYGNSIKYFIEKNEIDINIVRIIYPMIK